MEDSGAGVFQSAFLSVYDELVRRLSRKLGSQDAAYDVLHDVFTRLHGLELNEAVKNPKAYIFRMALNAAIDRLRAERRRLSDVEVDELLDLRDESPGPEQILSDRAEIVALKKAISGLPQRRREILMASRIEGIANRDLAEHYNVTVRTIEIEIKKALEHCMRQLRLKEFR